jgi:hypothetical protein
LEGTINILREELHYFMKYEGKKWKERNNDIEEYIHIICGSK